VQGKQSGQRNWSTEQGRCRGPALLCGWGYRGIIACKYATSMLTVAPHRVAHVRSGFGSLGIRGEARKWIHRGRLHELLGSNTLMNSVKQYFTLDLTNSIGVRRPLCLKAASPLLGMITPGPRCLGSCAPFARGQVGEDAREPLDWAPVDEIRSLAYPFGSVSWPLIS
jgi:hypothetical protein